MNRLALGSAQFGMPYGISNQLGQVPLQEIMAILGQARAEGIDTVDTHIDYGLSQDNLGNAGVAEWQVVTKLPGIFGQQKDISQWADSCLKLALDQLRVKSIYGLLLHHPEDLLGSEGDELYQVLRSMKEQGLVEKIGVSVYAPHDLERLVRHFDFDLVQLPLNVFDQRFIQSGWLEKLKKTSIEIHGRSVFLQGLLLMDFAQQCAVSPDSRALFADWHQWLQDSAVHPVKACLDFALSHYELDRIIVGVAQHKQLQEILDFARETQKSVVPEHIFSHNLELIDPRCWKK